MCDSTIGCCRLNDTGSKIKALMWPHRKKSIGVRFCNLGDQATGLPRQIQRLLFSLCLAGTPLNEIQQFQCPINTSIYISIKKAETGNTVMAEMCYIMLHISKNIWLTFPLFFKICILVYNSNVLLKLHDSNKCCTSSCTQTTV